MDYRMLQSGDVVKGAVFCGYAKSYVLNKIEKNNTAYNNELYVLSCTILPELRDYALLSILYSGHKFIKLENRTLTVNSKFTNAKKLGLKKEDLNNIEGKIDINEVSLWQLKMGLIKGNKRKAIKFFSTDEYLSLLESNANYRIDDKKDHEIICKFLSDYIEMYKKAKIDITPYVKKIYPMYRKEDSKDYFYEQYRVIQMKDKFCFEKREFGSIGYFMYGSCNIQNYTKSLNLLAERTLNWSNFYR